MKTKKSEKSEDWTLARRQAAESGIILTRRKRSDGTYVCYMNPKSGCELPGAEEHRWRQKDHDGVPLESLR